MKEREIQQHNTEVDSPEKLITSEVTAAPRIYRSVTRHSNRPTAHFRDNLDLEKSTTVASITAPSIHGFDISRVDTNRSVYHPQLAPFATQTSYVEPTHSSHNSPPPVQSPPDGGYGWVCVVAVFFINAHTWGINSSYGVFLAHYLAANSFPGTTALDYAFVGALSISCGVAISPIAALISRYCGLRFTLLLGAAVEAVSLIGASWATEIWHLFLSQGAGFGVGFGLLFVGSVGVVSQWFSSQRSVANGVATAGSGIGGLIYSLATSAMLRNLGQPWTFRVLGILAFAVNGICAVLLKEWPSTPARPTIFTRARSTTNTSTSTQQNTPTIPSPMFNLSSLLRRPSYLILLLYATLSMLGYISLLFSLSSYGRSILHLSPENAALLTALLNLSQGFGRPTIGLLSDRLGRLNMACFGSLLAGLATLVIWTNAHTFAAMIVYSILCGCFVGTFWATIAPVTAEVVEVDELIGPALNTIWLALALPCTFAAPVAFRLTVVGGVSYLGCQLFCGWMLIGAAAVLWVVRCWKLAEGERVGREIGVAGIVRCAWRVGKV